MPTTFNRSAIMSKAWELYRERLAAYAPWQIARGIAAHVTFANALREAWRQAKANAAFRAREAAVARAVASGREDVIRIARAIEFLPYSDSLANVAAEQSRLEAELNAKLAA